MLTEILFPSNLNIPTYCNRPCRTQINYSARRLMWSRLIESAAFCNQIWLAQLFINSAQNTSVNYIIRLLLSLLCRPKVILLSGGHCTIIRTFFELVQDLLVFWAYVRIVELQNSCTRSFKFILYELILYKLISFELIPFELILFKLISYKLILFELISSKLISFVLLFLELLVFELIEPSSSKMGFLKIWFFYLLSFYLLLQLFLSYFASTLFFSM